MTRPTKALLGLALLAGCDRFKSAPEIPKARRDRLDEIAELQSKIDLAIAQNDWQTIEFHQYLDKRQNDAYQDARGKGDPETIRILQEQVEKADAELDKAFDQIARHRCSR